jgi:hypothetical protein
MELWMDSIEQERWGRMCISEEVSEGERKGRNLFMSR